MRGALISCMTGVVLAKPPLPTVRQLQFMELETIQFMRKFGMR